MNPAGRVSSDFPNALGARLRRADLPPDLAAMQVIDFAPLLRPEHYYDLDDHLRESGHELVAQTIVAAQARLGAYR